MEALTLKESKWQNFVGGGLQELESEGVVAKRVGGAIAHIVCGLNFKL